MHCRCPSSELVGMCISFGLSNRLEGSFRSFFPILSFIRSSPVVPLGGKFHNTHVIIDRKENENISTLYFALSFLWRYMLPCIGIRGVSDVLNEAVGQRDVAQLHWIVRNASWQPTK